MPLTPAQLERRFPDITLTIGYIMKRFWHDLRDWLITNTWQRVDTYRLNRFVAKTHQLNSPQLTVGHWHDLDDRILYCVMDEFVRFIEVDLARWEESITYKKYEWILGRCPEGGLTNIRRVIADHSRTGSEYSKKMRHAYKEMLAIYTWWVQPRTEDFDNHEEATKYLIRLMKIRSYLWT